MNTTQTTQLREIKSGAKTTTWSNKNVWTQKMCRYTTLSNKNVSTQECSLVHIVSCFHSNTIQKEALVFKMLQTTKWAPATWNRTAMNRSLKFHAQRGYVVFFQLVVWKLASLEIVDYWWVFSRVFFYWITQRTAQLSVQVYKPADAWPSIYSETLYPTKTHFSRIITLLSLRNYPFVWPLWNLNYYNVLIVFWPCLIY